MILIKNSGFGVYQIRNILNDNLYIGCTFKAGFKSRHKGHRSALRHGNHHCLHLQNAWNKYGEDNFIFEVIEEFKFPLDYPIDLIKTHIENREQYYFDKLNPRYNILKRAGSPLGKKHTQETIEKIRQGNLGSFEERYGLERSQLIKEKIATSKHKLSDLEVINIIQDYLNGNNVIVLSQKYHLSTGTISGIINRRAYKLIKLDDLIEQKLKQLVDYNQKHKNQGIKRSKEFKKKISESHKKLLTHERKQRLVAQLYRGPLTQDMKNQISKANKGRFVGDENPSAILNERQVIQIKNLLNKGVLVAVIANLFNMSKSAISKIKTNRTWGHLNDV